MSAPVIVIGDAGLHHWRRAQVAGVPCVVDAYLRPWDAARLARVRGQIQAQIRIWEAAGLAGNKAAAQELPPLWARAGQLDRAAALLAAAPAVHQVTVAGDSLTTTLRCLCGAVLVIAAHLGSAAWRVAVGAFTAVHRNEG